MSNKIFNDSININGRNVLNIDPQYIFYEDKLIKRESGWSDYAKNKRNIISK